MDPQTPSSQDTQLHCPKCRTPVAAGEDHFVADLTEKVDKLLDAVVAIGLALEVDGFEEEE